MIVKYISILVMFVSGYPFLLVEFSYTTHKKGSHRWLP